MQTTVGLWRALANAGMVLAILAVSGFGMVQVAGRHWQVQKTFPVRVALGSIGGLEAGNEVRVQGIDAGAVERIEPPAHPGDPVTLVLRVDARLRHLVRADALARVVTEGVVGARVVEIVPGQADAQALPPSGVIAAEPPIEVADLLRKASDSLARLDQVADVAEESLVEIQQIAATIRRGEGSLGKLVQDDEAYRKLVALTDRGEHTLNDLEDNLAALKRTWPLSRYFNGRSFFDRDKVLFHPGAERESRTLREDELFEPGRATLITAGRKQLDEVAAWFKKVRRPASEIVIAAFTDDNRDPEMAQALTQEQADAVRKYLVSSHQIDSAGWFVTRKVAAVGFGNDTPRVAATGEGPKNPPPRRVEIIVFTPQS
jgi:phospholipid/cholesterol/gamma-HCH transport system substrate-binding protein